MGELAYVEARKQEALAWIKAHPREFLTRDLEKNCLLLVQRAESL